MLIITVFIQIFGEVRKIIAVGERKNMEDLISRRTAIDEIEGVDWYHQNKNGEMVHGANSKEHQPWYKSQDIYKALKAVPAVDAVPVVRCKYCRWGREVCGNIECFVDSNIPLEYHGYEWFCPNGERRTDE
jgi:hypothetical protein